MLSPELIETISRVVDPRLGIIRRISEVPLQPGEPPLFVLAAHCSRPKYFLRNAEFPASEADYTVPANGVGLNKEQALWRVLGEACERYTAGIYSEESLVIASRKELGESALPMEALIKFSDAQYARAGFPFVRFDPEARIRWARGTCLTRNRPSLIPAVLVYLGYDIISSREIFYPTLSTGMAAGKSLEQALLNGLCEAVERDAFMSTWLLRRAPERVPFASMQRLLDSSELALVTNENVEVCVAMMNTDIVLPSVLTVIRPRGRSVAVVGCATHPQLRRAIVGSVLEAYHTLNWSIFLERAPAEPAGPIRDFEDHVRHYLDERNFEEIAWLMQGEEHFVSETFAPRSNRCDELLEHARRAVESAGYEIHFVEMTTADVRRVGFRTARVLVPGLHPLNVGADTAHEDDRRLRRVAGHWRITMPTGLNPHPHPFP